MKILNQIIDHWRHDWATNKPLFWLEMVGTLLNIIATVTVTVMAVNVPMLFIFSLWIPGAFLMALSSYIRGNSWVFMLMGSYFILNTLGLVVLLNG